MIKLVKNKTIQLKEKTNSYFFLTLISLAIPIIIQNFMAASLNLVDNIMVGQLGDNPVAAVGLANQVYFIFNLFLLGVGGGASMFIAQFWGKKDIKNIRRILGLSLLLSVSTSIIIIAVSALIPEMIMSLLSNDKTVITLGANYLRISCFSYLFYAISTIFAVSMRSVGHAKPPMVANVIGLVLNSTLNYALIFGFAGFPAMGVVGAAIATCIARFVEMAIIVVTVYSKEWPSSAKLKEMLDLNLAVVKSFFSQSGLLIFKDVIWAVGISIYMGIYSRMGTEVIAAINIVQAIQQISFVFFVGISIACQIMIGNQIGAGNNETAQTYGKRFFILSTLSSIIVGLILVASRKLFLLPYNVSGKAISNAMDLIFIFSLYIPFTMTNVLFVIGVLRSGGDTYICIVMDLIAIYCIGMPFALLGAFKWDLSITVIYALVMSQEIFKSIVLLARFQTKKWIKNIIHNLN